MSSEKAWLRLTLALIMLVCAPAFGQVIQGEIRVKRLVGLEYPWYGRLGIIQGNVELAANVSRDGSVKEIRIISGVAPLAVPAKEALLQWEFSGCNSENGCEIHVTFSFVLSGSCDASSHCPSDFQVDLPDRVKITAKSIKAIVN